MLEGRQLLRILFELAARQNAVCGQQAAISAGSMVRFAGESFSEHRSLLIRNSTSSSVRRSAHNHSDWHSNAYRISKRLLASSTLGALTLVPAGRQYATLRLLLCADHRTEAHAKLSRRPALPLPSAKIPIRAHPGLVNTCVSQLPGISDLVRGFLGTALALLVISDPNG
jgi:hypothetical protein